MVKNEEFDWDAFMRDTLEASPATAGAWLRCLYKMRLSVTRGRISLPIETYARLFGADRAQTEAIIAEIHALNIGEVEYESNGNITLTNRRMFREWEAKEGNRIRQLRWQEKNRTETVQENNAPITEKYEKITNSTYIYSSSLNSQEDKKDTRRKKNKIYVEQIFSYWQTTLNHPKAKLTKERARAIESRLAEGYAVDEIERAIDGCKNSPHHMGVNSTGTVYDDLTLICRNGSKVEQFIGYNDRKEVQQNGTDINNGRPAKPTSASRIAEHRTILDQYIPEADLGNIS